MLLDVQILSERLSLYYANVSSQSAQFDYLRIENNSVRQDFESKKLKGIGWISTKRYLASLKRQIYIGCASVKIDSLPLETES
ncbi:MAG: hypothetical protein J07AB43_05860 [Candidatus Nanosalina sp. J07AB43]|nr:MAG: hypothetical protein J07AB43_05860 [Candidatus Nanosalina sp. J07AB43]